MRIIMIFCHSNNLLFNYTGAFGMYGALPCGNPFSGSNVLKNLVFGFTAGLMQGLRCFNPFMMNSDYLLYSYPSVYQNLGFYRYSDYTAPMPSFESAIMPNNKSNVCNIFDGLNDYKFNFGNNSVGFDTFNFSNGAFGSTFKVSSSNNANNPEPQKVDKVTQSQGTEVKDGTPKTVDGIDYGVFGKDAEKVKKLRPEMQKKVELLYKFSKNKDWNITLVSGFRSREQQEALYKDKLAGKKKCAVAKPGTSRHEYGCAVDLAINGSSKNGNPKLKELAKYAKSIGLSWGGDHFNEDWHFDIDPKVTPKG